VDDSYVEKLAQRGPYCDGTTPGAHATIESLGYVSIVVCIWVLVPGYGLAEPV
jgi:hypothetical protein